MSKLFDNSGKNTQNEIYDTSHHQYWVPPGHVAWKDNLVGFLGIIVSIILVALIDCFVLHPIPAPEGTFDPYSSSSPQFSLAESDCEYADATVLSSMHVSPDYPIYLVEQNGERHLLLFDHSILFTYRLFDDQLITSDETQTLTIGKWMFRANVTIEDGTRLTNFSSAVSLLPNLRNITLACYAIIGFAIALAGSVIWHKIKKLL